MMISLEQVYARHPGQMIMIVYTRFENNPLLFSKPLQVISCNEPARFERCFQEIEQALSCGHYVAGFISYEAGYCFEERLREIRNYDFPLLCFGVYRAPEKERFFLKRKSGGCRLNNLSLNISRDAYSRDILSIRSQIRQGQVYQITYCIKVKFRYLEEPLDLFGALLEEQPVPYPAYLSCDGTEIISCSPELFFKKQGGFILTKPMKGTWPRDAGRWEDFLARKSFRRDQKNRAENVMIADLLRNDLGRIGTRVKAPRLFEITGYRKLFQMTSSITARIPPQMSVYALFSSLFPSGSVTGAPKIRSMQIIRDLEKEERKIYTGAIGYITPEKNAFFNIPIRTVLIRNAAAEMGIGGGIVWDSTPEGEWEEGLLKARFLTDIVVEKDLSLQ